MGHNTGRGCCLAPFAPAIAAQPRTPAPSSLPPRKSRMRKKPTTARSPSSRTGSTLWWSTPKQAGDIFWMTGKPRRRLRKRSPVAGSVDPKTSCSTSSTSSPRPEKGFSDEKKVAGGGASIAVFAMCARRQATSGTPGNHPVRPSGLREILMGRFHRARAMGKILPPCHGRISNS